MNNFAQRRVSTRLLGLAVALAFAACGGSTTIEQSWKAPNLPPNNLRNVVTVCISRDATMRRTVEDSMAQRLAHMGVRAVPTYSILSDDDLKDRDRAKAKLVAGGYDGVVALRLVGKETKLVATPMTFDGYWGMAWPGAYGPGYLSTETVVRVETNVFSLADNKLVWSGLSKTVDPNTMRSAVDDITKVVAKALENQQIVASAGGAAAPS
ncbi:MAG TPA: hypothetical protein VF469_22570 [Kofleriaceae bacterium]